MSGQKRFDEDDYLDEEVKEPLRKDSPFFNQQNISDTSSQKERLILREVVAQGGTDQMFHVNDEYDQIDELECKDK